MKKYILFILLTLIIKADSYGQFYENISIKLSTEVGFDMQTRSTKYILYGPLFIPSRLGSSVLRIDKPTRYDLELLYKQNDNLEYYLSIGQTIRDLRYWRLDSTYTDNREPIEKLDLSIKHIDVSLGLKFNSNLNDKLNFYFIPSVGMSFGKTSSFHGITKEDPQAELIYLNDQRVGVLVHVYYNDPIIFISSEIGIEYKLFKNTAIIFGFRYNNEIVNQENEIIIWAYNIKEDRLPGEYTPYYMQFKSLFTKFGLKYSF